MLETFKFLKENTKVNYLSTIDEENWIRINCQLIDDSNNISAKQAVINEFDWAIESGYTLDNPDFQILYMTNADATIYNEDGEIISTHQF